MNTPCEICAAPGDLYLCNRCQEVLQEELDEIPLLLEELNAKLESPVQNKFRLWTGNNPGGKDSAAPSSLEVMKRRSDILNLNTDAGSIARSPGAYHETLSTVSSLNLARLSVSQPPELRLWPSCTTPECSHQIAAPVGQSRARCPGCGWVKSLSDLVSHRLSQLNSRPLLPRQVRQSLEEMTGIRVSKKTFENWVYSGRLRYVLDRVGTENKDRRLYTVTDLLVAYQRSNMVP